MRTILGVAALACAILEMGPAAQGGGGRPLAGKKVLLIIAADKFRDEELFKPQSILTAAGAEVTVASTVKGQKIKGMLGGSAEAGLLVGEARAADYAAVIFVGGAGAAQYWDDAAAHRLAQETLRAGRLLAAICIAPVTLARAGLLRGRRATVWPEERAELERAGALYQAGPVIVDGGGGKAIVTAAGPQAAGEFGRKIVELLTPKTI